MTFVISIRAFSRKTIFVKWELFGFAFLEFCQLEIKRLMTNVLLDTVID